MAGRFPFDPHGGNNPGRQVSNAQMRAALGLPSVDELSANLYVEQQQRLEAQQRDLRYRHALYQDQLDHQLQELQLRANAVAELEQLPELQQHYANLLLRERLAHGADAEQRAAAQHQQQLAYRRQAAAAAAAAHHEQHAAVSAAGGPSAHSAFGHPSHPASVQAAAAAQLRFQEELRQQQQQQQQQQQSAALHAHLRGPPGAVPGLDQLVIRNTGSNASAAAALSPAAMAGGGPPQPPPTGSADESVAEEASVQQQQQPSLSRKSSVDVDSVELEDLVIEQHKKQHPDLAPTKGKKGKRRRATSDASGPNPDNAEQDAAPKRRRGRPRKSSDAPAGKSVKSKKDKPVDEDEQRMRAEAILQAMAERASGMRYEPGQAAAGEDSVPEAVDHQPAGEEAVARTEEQQFHLTGDNNMEDAATPSSPVNAPPLGTLEGLLAAANQEEKVFDCAHVLQHMKDAEWPESDQEEEDVKQQTMKPKEEYLSATPGLPLPKEPSESIVTNMLDSRFPKLPEEPVFDEEPERFRGIAPPVIDKNEMDLDESGEEKARTEEASSGEDGKVEGSAKKVDKSTQKRKSNVLDYPYPVDVWWPSTAGRRRERRHAGEISDEDAFEDPEPQGTEEPPLFRANKQNILDRLQSELEPGVLEKIPHCRIHRAKRKGAGALTELVYCFQVTECYPSEMMVCCSVCGTWRHAACGGHYEPFSTRKNLEEPFVAVCEQCHEEQKIMSEHPVAKARIDRQRMEQLRRGLATTAVMRSMSFSKHGGTYKWPLGSVSATHVGGHTRSVQARHDKAEKQWADLLTRLGRGYGYRTKERQRVRTKELERLLVAVEDAEGQTDRHNMLLFLMRDTKKKVPTGFEEEHKNLFDPSCTDEEFDSLGYTPTSRRSENQQHKKHQDPEEEKEVKERPKCLRADCNNRARFDSRFCSDGCGVHVLQLDLLEAFYESNEIHPSVLRSHY